MAKYAVLADVVDKSLRITERHCLDADAYVDAQLNKHGIVPSEVTALLPVGVLTQIASAWAKRLAAIEQAVDTDTSSPLVTRSREYERIAHTLSDTLSREALGLSRPASTGFGFFSLGRG